MIKPITKLIVICLSLAALTGCDMEGTLSVNQSVNLVDKKGRQVPIVAGQRYKTELGKDGDKVKFDIKIDGKDREIRLPIPRGAKFPKYNGELMITAAQSGQPVDFYGVVETKVYEGPDRRGYQNCTVQIQVRVCRPEGCNYEWRQVSGNQEVIYYDRTTVTSGHVSLLAPGTRTVRAQYEGSSSSTEQIVTWAGRCETPYGQSDLAL